MSAEPSGSLPREGSEADVPLHIHAAKLGPVHVHGEMAKKKSFTPPQHHDSHKFNFAAAAKEEMHDVAVHPPTPHLVGKTSGVEAIDKVNATLPHHTGEDLKELVTGWVAPSSPRAQH